MGDISIFNGIINQKKSPAIYQDNYANRPVAGYTGRLFVSDDTGQIFADTGSTWILVADAGVGGGTLSSVCVNGNTTATGIVITANGLTTNSAKISGLTQDGGVLFTDATGNMLQDVNFTWDATNNYLGIGPTGAPSAPLDIHNSTLGVQVQINATSTNNSAIAFQNASVGKWRVGNLYSAGANLFHIYNNTAAGNALTITSANAATFTGSVTAASLAISGGTSSQFLKANGTTDSTQYISLTSLSATSPLVYNNGTGAFTILQSSSTQSGYLSSTDWSTFNSKASLGSFSATSPLAYNSGTGAFTIQVANSGQSGYLTSTDWNTFNNKQSALTFGNLTESTSSVLTITGGTDAVIGSGTTIQIKQSSATQSGYLSSTDWNTFNNKASALNGTGFVKANGTTISYDNSTYYLASNPNNYITLTSLGAASPLVYNNTSGGFSIQLATTSTSGYLSSTDWNTFNSKQGTITLTTTGSSGAATLVSNTLNIPNYGSALSGYLPLTGGTLTGALNGTSATFSGNITAGTTAGGTLYAGTVAAYQGVFNYDANGYTTTTISNTYDNANAAINFKLRTAGISVTALTLLGTGAATFASSVTATSIIKTGGTSSQYLMADGSTSTLTNPVTGTGTANYLPKFTAGTTIGNSLVQDNGSTVSIITGSTVLSLDRTGGATALIELKTGGTVRSYLGADTSMPFVFFNQAASPLMYLNASGNLGLGVTPSAWASGTTALEIGSGSALWNPGSSGYTILLTNAYNNGTNYIYKATRQATIYVQNDGNHIWYNAPSGTAGSAISFTQAMTLTANGNLLINTATDSGYKLDVNGTGRFSDALTIRNSSVSSGGSAINAYGFDGAADLYTTRQENPYNAALYLHNNPITGQGYGTGILFRAKSDAINSRVQGNIYTTWTTATDASRTSKMVFSTTNSGVTSEKLTIEGTGAATFSSTLGINGVSDNVKSGTYTPTSSGFLNVTSVTAINGRYQRVGDSVTVTMEVSVTSTSTVAAFYVSIPVGSNFTTGTSADGAGLLISTAGAVAGNGTAAAQSGSTNLLCTVYSASLGTLSYIVNFQYKVY